MQPAIGAKSKSETSDKKMRRGRRRGKRRDREKAEEEGTGDVVEGVAAE